MPPRSVIPRLSLAFALAATVALAGCSNEANTPEAKIAEQAVGVQPARDSSKSVKEVHDLTVIDTQKVIDNKTGQVLSEKSKSTPVKITEQTQEKTDVKVNVGDPKSTATK